ncbi:hypothetical protein B0O99DRAFT_708077 [Bisporella sp. PMI_857]|nr:hypothetical protein B0O99DRAFT_708077 [Bisporella sp. PMI_857]
MLRAAQLALQSDHFVNRIEYSLQMNIEILHLLSSEAKCRAEKEGPHSADQYERFQDRIKFRDAIALQDSHSMMSMNEKTICEAQTMRTITILALIYLPASFTATFLDMGYIHVTSLSGIMRIRVDQDMWFYLAITVPLMVVTILSWRLWELKMRYKSAMKPAFYEDVEKNKDV